MRLVEPATVQHMRRLLIRMQSEVLEHCGGAISDTLRATINETDALIWKTINANKADIMDGEDICACQNCDWRGTIAQCDPIQDIFQRVAPGETMPAGECPDCGALTQVCRQVMKEAANG